MVPASFLKMALLASAVQYIWLAPGNAPIFPTINHARISIVRTFLSRYNQELRHHCIHQNKFILISFPAPALFLFYCDKPEKLLRVQRQTNRSWQGLVQEPLLTSLVERAITEKEAEILEKSSS